MSSIRYGTLLATVVALLLGLSGTVDAAKKNKKAKGTAENDPYADLVWPPPPDEARIKLDAVLTGRADVEAKSRLRRMLIGASPQSPYDTLRKPFAVAFDRQGRILVTDWGTAALVRFDLSERRFDVLGTRSNPALKQPLGLAVGRDDSLYVADVGLRQVVKFDPSGKILKIYGRAGELTNPTDAAVSPDGARLYVTDSKEHRVVVFDEHTAELVSSFGERGGAEGSFHFPTSLAFDAEGDLLVVDQMNARVQLFASDGEYLDEFGGRGVGFGNFSRPKDVAVDDLGLIYVTDNAFNNVQLFDADFTLLSFIGQTGSNPGRFWGASGVAVHHDRFAVVDQLGARVQVFRYLQARDRQGVASVARAEPSAATSSAGAADEVAPELAKTAQSEGRTEQQVETSVTPEAAPPVGPASPPGAPAPLSPGTEPGTATEDEIAGIIENWRSAWAEQRVEDLLACYAPDFSPPGGLTREAWAKQRRERLTRPRFIEVRLEELSIELLGPAEARATFVQTYQSDRFGGRVRRALRLRREDGGWLILQEGIGALPLGW